MALFTQLDADLVSNLVELASSPDCPDDELVIDETKYLDGSAQDRHVYASFDQGAWPASPDRQTWVREIVCRVGQGRMHESARSLWARIHFEGSNGAEDDYVLGMRVDGKDHIEWYEEQLSRGLALHDGVCEVWVPPPPPEKLKKDAWWSKHYLKPGHEDGSISYKTYRTYIDDVILDAIQDFDALPLNGRVLELCAGDGAFMERLLGRRPDVASYVFVERNADLCRRARDRCASAIVEGLCVDACAARRRNPCRGGSRRSLALTIGFVNSPKRRSHRRHVDLGYDRAAGCRSSVRLRLMRPGRVAGHGRARAASGGESPEADVASRRDGLHAVVS